MEAAVRSAPLNFFAEDYGVARARHGNVASAEKR